LQLAKPGRLYPRFDHPDDLSWQPGRGSMTFDVSRFPFDPTKDYLGVVKQQGRVDLDSDWNEFQAELARRIQAGTIDAFGRAVVPATTPYGFKINASVDVSGQEHVTIGAGRMYVDGLLIENHGTLPAASWDPSLAELNWAPPGGAEVDLDYTQQPYFPGGAPPLPGGNGPFLVYVDVWRRPVSWLDDPNLIEVAVGVDTTGRLQTAWQVRLLDVSAVSGTIAGGITCSTPDSAIPPWLQLLQAPASRLTTGVVPSPSSGPCSLAPATGYTGLENQLYRVEIHQGGTANATGTVANPSATFKWSRDNGSVMTTVTAIAPATNAAQQPTSQLTVQSTGRDSVLGFAPGNWIEIIDDYAELNGLGGELHLIDVNGVDPAASTIRLATPVSAGFAQRLANTATNYHTRITRWDQAGQVMLSDGATVWVDLGAPGSSGQIPVPPPGTALILEDGITAAFDLAPGGGSFVAGDWWAFTARIATGEVLPLIGAPPFGVHHHYARLAIVTFPSTASDCRSPWPILVPPCCGCTLSMAPGDITTNLSLQTILNNYANQPGPSVICLQAGTYTLPAPLRLAAAHSNITLKACQPGTVVLQAAASEQNLFGDGLIVLDNATNVSLSGLHFVVPLVAFSATQFAGLPLSSFDPDVQSLISSLSVSIAVRPFNCTGLTIQDCLFDLTPMQNASQNATPFGVGVFAGGQCLGWRLEGNTFNGAGDFAAGFLLATSVSFNPPPPVITIPPVTTIPPVITTPPVVATSRVVTTPPVTLHPSARASSTTRASVPGSSPRLGIAPIVGSGFLRFTNIFQLGTSSSGLAARGGAVIPATLSGATFKSNTFANLTLAVLSIAGTASVSSGTGNLLLAENTVTSGTGGFWLLSPLQASALANVPLDLPFVIGLSVALGYPLPQGDATPPVQVATAPASVRICTDPQSVTDSAGNQWTPDTQLSGVTRGGTSGLNHNVPLATITGCATQDQPLYQYERWGESFSYTFTGLSAGYYKVTLKFAELFHNQAGQREFNVSINSVQVLTDFDIFVAAGDKEFAANDQVFTNITAPNGQIVIQFTAAPGSPDQNAKVGAVEVDAQWSAALANPGSLQGGSGATRITEIQNFFAQSLALAEQGFATLTMPARQLRIAGNEMQGLTSTAVLLFGDDGVQNGLVSSLVMNGNRLDSTAVSPATSDQVQGQTPGDAIFYWLSTVAIAAVTRCVVSGNMATVSGWQIGGLFDFFDLPWAFLLDDTALPAAAVSVMANMFGAPMVVVPNRPAQIAALPNPAGTWQFLNTTPVL
jgi:hypothetical protein